MTQHTDFEDDYPEGIASLDPRPEPLTAMEGCAFVIASFVAAAFVLYGLALIAQGLINIFQIFGRIG